MQNATNSVVLRGSQQAKPKFSIQQRLDPAVIETTRARSSDSHTTTPPEIRYVGPKGCPLTAPAGRRRRPRVEEIATVPEDFCEEFTQLSRTLPAPFTVYGGDGSDENHHRHCASPEMTIGVPFHGKLKAMCSNP
ncbi:unnamed protein product [Microthlaspi erraticum]|uniref:Uncharacterized protein n=1 Tax=Microthlaspi erraticum TaxID=1685480 RepID=A0A6D2JR87_9BRAS|nr:unnamed protein product [Microthlaspi erraticum]